MTEEIKPQAVYTTSETEKLLKISNSTMKRLLKSGLLKANKVGKQYRILGLEILKLVSPKAEEKTAKTYLDLKHKVIEKTKEW
ncbi:helix-turn-helix domain-containing protein [Candidatus Falkowbacteria bacterium]|jgi:excisionase family DNA binding protein|nr:helix-turn-helix domain-containing protein [Candidatus Falkowbacteria bacterium]